MLVAAAAFVLCVQDPSPAPIVVREVLAVGALSRRARSALYADPVESAIARGAFSPPVEGGAVRAAGGAERTWTRVAAGEDGWFSSREFRGGYAFATVEIPEAGAWMLDLRGASTAWVDGEPHAGDVYTNGLTRIPLALTAGRHELLFRGGRGRLYAAFERAPAPVYFEDRDRTLPHVIRGEGGEVVAGQIVANATGSLLRGLRIRARLGDVSLETEVPAIGPASFRKCVVRVPNLTPPDGGAAQVALELVDAAGEVLHATGFELAVRGAHDKHVRTFVSRIDGSVQYYGVTPPPARAEGEVAPAERPGLALSLHGAGVEGAGQANSYAQKPDLFVVAPTNRRAFGFDWEDWGRMDAIEVLELAEGRFGTDPRRTWLTGHSMGGHGTWQVGAQFPGRFAAIAPSAGWREFWTYGGQPDFGGDDPVGQMLVRALSPSRTRLLDQNYRNVGVYILHGDRDDNVPVTEARAMRARLAEYHPNFAYYEQPGAGHWWGNACVDWPPLFEFLRRNTIPEPTAWRRVEFVTANPAINSRCSWVRVEAQVVPLEPTRVAATIDPAARKITVEAENLARVAFDLWAYAAPQPNSKPLLPTGEPVTIEVEGTSVQLAFEDTSQPLRIERLGDGAWRPAARFDPRRKGPHRAGPFKEAFQDRMVFVYGTQGSAEMNAWAFQKARYDHETWRYRGNGAVEVIADVDFDPADYADRGVILYGSRTQNAAWPKVLADASFDVEDGRLRIGDRTLTGDSLALLAVHPRRDSDVASVAVIAGTGLPGAHTTDHLPYFVSGVAYPDWTVLDVTFLEEGLAGIQGAGFFGHDWRADGEGASAVWR